MTKKKAESLERLIDVAGEEFARHGFEEVSVSEIAQRSRCSTSTIYDVYGGKAELFRSAMLRRLTMRMPKSPDPNIRPALLSLLHYFDKRMRSLASRESREVSRAIIEQSALVGSSVTPEMFNQRQKLQEVVNDQASLAIAEGAMKNLPLDLISYHLAAMCAYEAVLCGMTFGFDYEYDFNEVTHKAFMLLVTESGAKILEAFLDRNPVAEP